MVSAPNRLCRQDYCECFVCVYIAVFKTLDNHSIYLCALYLHNYDELISFWNLFDQK